MLSYSTRSERLLAEPLRYNLPQRWLVGLGVNEVVWHPMAFTKNRDRLRAGEVAPQFFAAIVGQAKPQGLLCSEHFSAGCTMLGR